MRTMLMPDPARLKLMSTAEMREAFLLEDLFKSGELVMRYLDADRTIVGSAVPGIAPLELPAADELRAEFFLERRELGVLNVGGKGIVSVDDTEYELDNLDALYVGRGSRHVRFMSDAGAKQAEFYLVSYPAHTAYPTVHAKKAQAAAVPVGNATSMNKRTIRKYIHMEGIKSCQLVMGFTELDAGSGWNTMPPHTHTRRSEVYLYFGLPEDARVFHMMGTPDETRHLLVANKQVVISPSWSIHCGTGTSNYSFCWAMGGENQAFDDMDAVAITSLR